MKDEEREDLVVLTDEEGKEHHFAVVDIFTVEQKDYAVLTPVEQSPEEETEEEEAPEEAYIFRLDKVDGEQTLVEVDDENEWETVASAWEDRLRNLEEGGGKTGE